MRLNLDCLRDILLCVEENADYYNSVIFVDVGSMKVLGDYSEHCPELQSYQEEFLRPYSSNEIMYHLRYCFHAGLIESEHEPNGMYCTVRDLTPEGHDFLSDIRNKSVFEKTKAIATELQAQSIPAVQKIASSVISAIIQARLNL